MQLETPDLTYQTTRYATYACEYHILWCTKYRRSALSPEIQARFKELVLEADKPLCNGISNLGNPIPL